MAPLGILLLNAHTAGKTHLTVQQELAIVNIAEDEHNVLFTGYKKGTFSNLALMHTTSLLERPCSSTICGENWLENYLDSLGKQDKGKVKQTVGQKTFKFRGEEHLVKRRIQFSSSDCLKTDMVEYDIPLLLSRKAMKTAGVKMDLESDIAVIFWERCCTEFDQISALLYSN